MGSSPLTRGKPPPRVVTAAHPAAHPRSRGENSGKLRYSKVVEGSSPLTRGKHAASAQRFADLGLIPAHAGKTLGRVGGLNIGGSSSPLTRGKRARAASEMVPGGLIPAHAGKTARGLAVYGLIAAHPRSRGENVLHVHPDEHVAGSSPLTRGKPVVAEPLNLQGGLIPAHAGKTRG